MHTDACLFCMMYIIRHLSIESWMWVNYNNRSSPHLVKHKGEEFRSVKPRDGAIARQNRNDCSGAFGKCHMDGSLTPSERWKDGQRLGDF